MIVIGCDQMNEFDLLNFMVLRNHRNLMLLLINFRIMLVVYSYAVEFALFSPSFGISKEIHNV